MDSRAQQRQRIDSIALAFETQWQIETSASLLVKCYNQLPCDELLGHLVAADYELALRQGDVRDKAFYTRLFPGQTPVIERVLSEDDESGSSDWFPAREDSLVELATHFFPALPCSFGPYTVLRCVAGGGMAAVFEARLGEQVVALKLPYRLVFGARTFARRFEKEVSLLATLSHPSIVPVLDSGSIDGWSYYTMPLIEGEDLSAKCTIERFASLSHSQAVRYILQATQAVAYCHSQGILHRDLKPSNIIVDKADHVWIVDFGLGGFMDSQHSMTADGKLIGTPMWMSPEQARGDHAAVDARSDVYSLGATLYSMLTGRAPFSGTTTGQLLLDIQRSVLVPPRHLHRIVPKPLEDIVLKCMERSPKLRYQTADDLARDLTNFINGASVQAKPRSLPVRAYRWSRLYPRTSMGGVVGIAIILALSLSIIVLQHVVKLQRQLAENAELMRDAAVRSEAEQVALRDLADRERKKAEDAARFSEAQQMRMAFSQAAVEMRNGKAIDADLFRYSTRYSIDSYLYSKYSARQPQVIRAFCTGSWGHYDVAINRERSLLATAGRDGNVCIWDINREAMVRHCRIAEVDPDKGSTWNRWRYFAGETKGFTPKQPPTFYSSLSWTDQGTLLVAGLDGSITEFGLDGTERTLCSTHRKLQFIRPHDEKQEFLLVDDEGVCNLMRLDGLVVAECELGIEPAWAGYAAPINGWMVAGVGGELVFLDQTLKNCGRSSPGSRIHDIRLSQVDGSVTALIASQDASPQLYQLLVTDGQVQLQPATAALDNVDADSCVVQSMIDLRSNLLLALDDNGNTTAKNLADDRVAEFAHTMAHRDIRHPYPSEVAEFDSLEGRARYFLLPGRDGVIAVDTSGTVREFDFTKVDDMPGWRTLPTRVGNAPRIAADPKFPDRLWALDAAGTLRLVSLVDGSVLDERVKVHAGGTADLQVLSNGDVLTAGSDNFIHVWRFDEGMIAQLGTFLHAHPLRSVACHEETGLIGSVDANGDLVFFELSSCKLVRVFHPGFTDTGQVHSVRTGRLAFSESGRFVAAFTTGQNCAVIDLATFTLARTIDYRVGDTGGIDVCFSPVEERRFMFSSNSIGSNEIEVSGDDVNPAILQIPTLSPALDFVIPEDKRRITALLQNGQIAHFSPEHFVLISTWDTPTDQPSSIAIATANAAIAVAAQDGTVFVQDLESVTPLSQPILPLVGNQRSIDGLEHVSSLSYSSSLGLEPIRDGSGHLTQMFRTGGYTDKSAGSRLVRFFKDGDDWAIKPVIFEGMEDGPGEIGSLFLAPTGRMVAVVRQGTSAQDYNGRLLLLQAGETVWSREMLQADGNAGFCPAMLFATDGTVQSVLHFDFEWQRLLAHRRISGSDQWRRETIAGQVGFRTRSVRDPAGGCHLITFHLRGFDSVPPHQYLHIDTSGIVHQEEACGQIPLLHQASGKLFSFDPLNGDIWLKLPEGGWRIVTRTPFGNNGKQCPTFDDSGDFWHATCHGKHLVVARKNLLRALSLEEEWTLYRIELETVYPLLSATACNMNSEGELEILIYHEGDKSALAVIEVPIPAPKQTD